MSAPRLVSRAALLAMLRREQFNDGEGHSEQDVAFGRGWNARARGIIAWLNQGSVEEGLDELRRFDLSDTEQG